MRFVFTTEGTSKCFTVYIYVYVDMHAMQCLEVESW